LLDRVFEMHDPSLWERLHEIEEEPYRDLLRAIEVPLYMREQHEDIPASRRYPFEGLDYGEPAQSSAAYAVGMALGECKSGDRIGLWGIDMATGSEYAHQRANMRMLFGVAWAWGIEIVLPAGCRLKDDGHYGTVEWFDMRGM
jgi:hypothetical protein